MEGCIGRLADELLERFGGAALAEPEAGSPPAVMDGAAGPDVSLQKDLPARRNVRS
jgi:hypothetical protein